MPPLLPQKKRSARNKNGQQCTARRLVRAGALRLSTEGAPGHLAKLVHTGANRVRALQQAAARSNDSPAKRVSFEVTQEWYSLQVHFFHFRPLPQAL